MSCCGFVFSKQYNGVSSEDAISKSKIEGAMIEMEKIEYDNNGKVIQYLDNNNQPIMVVQNQKSIHNNIGAKLFDFMKKNKEEDDSRIAKNNNIA